jgi:hypothetical protein
LLMALGLIRLATGGRLWINQHFFIHRGLSTILACGFSLLNHNGLAQASVTMRAMMNVLIVRTSSMGDLIHTWPAITELKTHYPNLRISWLAEENFADIPRLHPAVEQVIPMAWRRWRKRLFAADTRAEMKAVYQQLQATRWDLVVDCQGLLKSAIPAKLSRGPLAGYDRHSIREPLACLLYDKTHRVDWSLSAVERCRLLLAKVFGYQPEGSPRFGVPAAAGPTGWRKANTPCCCMPPAVHPRNGRNSTGLRWVKSLQHNMACN